MRFQLFRRPGSLVLVDDDEAFLEQLKLLLPANLNVALHLSPRAVIPLVQANARLQLDDVNTQQALITREIERGAVQRVLDYWGSALDRYAIITTVLSDYFMPGMDGLEMFRRIGEWSGMRVLLTGQADEQVAVQAFNAGLINQYITKSTPNLIASVLSALAGLAQHAHPRYQHIWRGHLSTAHYEMLQDPETARDLNHFVDGHWVEHIVIGEPLGIIGLSANGVPGWLQLEPAHSLEVASQIAADAGVAPQDVEAIRAGRSVAAVEIGGFDPSRLVAPAVKFGGAQAMYGALFELWPQLPAGGYAQWLARQPARDLI